MRFLMFVVADPTGEDETGDVEAWVEENDGNGRRVMGDRLRPPSDAKTVRVRGGERFVTDGPFAETKEWIAGFDLLECRDLEEAVEVAAAHPMAQGGCIEVRPFWPFDEQA